MSIELHLVKLTNLKSYETSYVGMDNEEYEILFNKVGCDLDSECGWEWVGYVRIENDVLERMGWRDIVRMP